MIALKVMSTALASETDFRELFLREARVASRIEHANVVRVYDSGEVDGELFLAMELVEGASLARLQGGADPLPLPVALRVIHDALRGLHAAHELLDPHGAPLGLVHQDVSPHNVLVGYDGGTRLLDFGVARQSSRDRSRTDTIRGKPGYLAPEQIGLGRLDRRVDVFAVGVIAFELVTGRRLFVADSIAAMHEQILRGPIPSFDDAVPSAIAEVVARALERDPERRWPTADAFRRALRDAAAESGVALADEETVGELVRKRAPPTWSRASIERALSELANPEADVSELPTLAPRAAAHAIVADKERTRTDSRARRWTLIALGTFTVLAVVFATRWISHREPAIPSARVPVIEPASAAPSTSTIPLPSVSVVVVPSVSASIPAPRAPSPVSNHPPPVAQPTVKPEAPAPSLSAPPTPPTPAVTDDPFAHQ